MIHVVHLIGAHVLMLRQMVVMMVAHHIAVTTSTISIVHYGMIAEIQYTVVLMDSPNVH
jgi:hypothetical protein